MEKGRLTRALMSKVTFHDYPLTVTASAFLTDRGPFKAHLKNFRCIRTADSEYDALDITDHYYYYHWELAKHWNIRKLNQFSKT